MIHRLKEVRKELGLNQTDFAKYLGITPVSYTHLDVYKRQKERFAGCGPDKILYFLRDKLDAASFEAVLKVCEEKQE